MRLIYNNVFATVFLYMFGIFAFAVIVYSLLRGKRSSLLFYFVWYQGMLLILDTYPIVETFHFYQGITLYLVFKWQPFCFLGLSFLIFALRYTNNKLIANKRFIIGVSALPVLFYLLIIIKWSRSLFFTITSTNVEIHGMFFYLPIGVSYFYIMAATVFLLGYCLKQYRTFKKNSILLIFTATMILMLAIIYDAVNRVFQFDYPIFAIISAVVSAVLSSLLLALLTFRYRFLNFSVALQKMIESINEPVFFIDGFQQIIYYNHSFLDAFFPAETFKHNQLNSFINYLKRNLENPNESAQVIEAIEKGTSQNVKAEFCLGNSSKQYYTVNIEPVYKAGELLGRVVSFNNVSAYKNLMNELSVKNSEMQDLNHHLTDLNNQLKEYMVTVEELAIAKERNRFARDAHDTIGHTMAKIITVLEVCSIICPDDPALTQKKLNEATGFARDGLNEIRRSISGLVSEKLDVSNLKHSLQTLFADFYTTGIKIDFTMEGTGADNNPRCSDTIYRVCQEGMTNAVRHGKANNITIILRFIDSLVKLYIFDDGLGCKSVDKGFGLKSMEQRIKDLNGTIEFGSNDDRGFNIYVEIPLERLAEKDG